MDIDRGNYWLEKKNIKMNHNSVHDVLPNSFFNRSSMQLSTSHSTSHTLFEKDAGPSTNPYPSVSAYSLDTGSGPLSNSEVYLQEKLAVEWVNQRDEIVLSKEKGETVASFVLKNKSEKNWMAGMKVELKFGEKNIKVEREIPHEVRMGEEFKVDLSLAEHKDVDLSRDTAMLWIKGTDPLTKVKYFSQKFKAKIRLTDRENRCGARIPLKTIWENLQLSGPLDTSSSTGELVTHIPNHHSIPEC